MTRAVHRVHGGYQDPTDERDVLDLSTCVDSFGLFEPVTNALCDVHARRAYTAYPDPTALGARDNLAELCNVTPSEVDVGPGAAEILWTLVRTFVHPAQRVLVWEPCFSEFAHAAIAASASVISHVSFAAQSSMALRVKDFGEAVNTHSPAVAYLCAPSTPRGEWVPAELLREMVHGAPNTLFIIDQSYLNMSQHADERHVGFPSNAVLLRSVTKELGLPGVRAGYALMSAALRSEMQSTRPHWSLGTHAQAILQAYSRCRTLLIERQRHMRQQAIHLAQQLSNMGWQPELFDTPYFTVRAPRDKPLTARELARTLLEAHAIAVRDCTSFGLPHHVRIVAHPAQDRLIEALSTIELR